jgi:uncharacterized membrane protein YccC
VNGSAIANGVRAAIATLVPFFLAAALRQPALGWMALGGWLGTLVDPGGAKPTRARAVGAFTVLGAVLVPLAEYASGSTWAAALLLATAAFGGTLARVLGPAAATVGTLTAVVVAVGTARAGSGNVAYDALSFVAGAAWAAVLSSLVWPIGTHVPVRAAVSRVFAALAAYARGIDACAAEATDDSDPRWAALALAHHRQVRAAIEEALAVALAVRASRSGESPLGADLRVLLGMAEAQFPKLIALAEELEATPRGERPPEVYARLDAVAAAFDGVSKRVMVRWPRASTQAPAQAAPSGATASSAATASPVDLLAARLEEASARASTLAGALGEGGAVGADAREVAARRPALAGLVEDARELRDALSPRSVFFRHAVRVAAAVTVASFVGHRFAQQPHWVTVTTLAVLQPYPGPTWTRAAERVVGTLLGSVVAVGITMTVRSPLVLAAVMFPLSVAAVATRPRSHRLFAFFLTPVFVLIAEAHPGDWWTAVARATDAVVGGAIALVAAMAFWPSWERTRLPDALAAMLAAVAAYRDLVVASIDRDRDAGLEHAVAQARRTAGIALGEAETSLERALAEPVRSAAEGERAMQLITHARRLTNACTALDTRAAHGLASAPALRTVELRTVRAYADDLRARAAD